MLTLAPPAPPAPTPISAPPQAAQELLQAFRDLNALLGRSPEQAPAIKVPWDTPLLLEFIDVAIKYHLWLLADHLLVSLASRTTLSPHQCRLAARISSLKKVAKAPFAGHVPPLLPLLPSLQFKHKVDLDGVTRGPRLGRNAWDGYFRGCALQYANLSNLCYADPAFANALRMTEQRSIVTHQNLMNLFVLIKFYLPNIAHGHIVEYGSYKGGSAMFMASIAKALLPTVRVYAFDTFTGMPTTDRNIELHRSGDFADANLAEIRAAAAAFGLDNLTFIQGRFEESAADALDDIGPVALTHIDCDIRSAIACSYDATKPHMVPGSYIAFDDPLVSSCLGAFEAVEELLICRDGLHAEQVSPHLVFRYPPLASPPVA